ncbi:MAG: alpha-1,6-mannosyltransferase [Candidatus Latescibacterota bacterium]|jgi:alpha-1,6-mannosyltransferase
MPEDAALNANRAPSSPRMIAIPLLLFLGLEIALVYIVSLGDLREHVTQFWYGAFAASWLYGGAVLWVLHRREGSTRFILLAALLFRLTMWNSPASLSDDIYRYIWDGRVQLHGINPYRYAPDAPQLLPLRNDLHAQINHREVPTIYPPLAQLFFLAAAAVREHPATIKLGLIAFDFALCLLLSRLLTLRQQDPRRVLLYAWHPLPLVEIAGSGHIDALGIFFLMLALYALVASRKKAAACALAAAFLSKLVPALLLPIFWKLSGSTRYTSLRDLVHLEGRLPVFCFPLLCLLGLLPYAGVGSDMVAGLNTYLRHWHFNDFIYSALRDALQVIDPAAALHARWLCTALLLSTVYYTVKNTVDPIRAAFWLMGAYTLLSPTLHPWYVLWILPFMPFFCRWSWILFAALVLLAYEVLIDYSLTGVWSEKNWVKWAQYGPFYLALAAEFLYSYHKSNPERPRSV